MFVRQSTHDEVVKERNSLSFDCAIWKIKFFDLQKEWNKLIDKINTKGGQSFLDNGVLPDVFGNARSKKQFTDDELRSILQLVHPDKHGGKESAVRITKLINEMRSN